jgi:phosphatidate cytidylyltransferase
MDFPERPRPTPSGESAQPRRRRASGADEIEPPGFLSPEERAESMPPPGEEPGDPRSPRGRGRGFLRRGGPKRPRRRKQRSETLMRVLWAIPAIILAVTVIALGGEAFAGAMVVFSWIAMGEFFRMTERARPFAIVAYAAAAGMIVAAHYGDSFHMVLAGVAFFPVMLGLAARRQTLRNVTYSMAVTVFALVWIAIPFAHAVLLRDLPDHGAALLVDVLVATFFTDTFAYIGGRMLGSRPLAPLISPNKTVEGLAVGILGGILGFWLAGLYQDWLSGTDALLMGACIALLAPLGDLFESAIKRDLDVKDSGRVFGPHGGMLDRLDGVLFTVVAGYYLSLAIVY